MRTNLFAFVASVAISSSVYATPPAATPATKVVDQAKEALENSKRISNNKPGGNVAEQVKPQVVPVVKPTPAPAPTPIIAPAPNPTSNVAPMPKPSPSIPPTTNGNLGTSK